MTLHNIRSHVNSSIEFEGGFNCLIGGLGAGKSSILYAVDFALFGDPLTRSYNYLLREGENKGRVSVEFLLNGKTYRIERGLKRKRKGKSIGQELDSLKLYDEEKLIASMNNEAIAEQLEAITGLDKETFREVVWIRQEHLKELLNVSPRERQKRFDQLFGLSDYELAWTNIREVQREYEGERKAYEKDFDVLGIEKLETGYHAAVEEFSNLTSDILNQENKLLAARKTLETLANKLRNLEKSGQQTQELLKKEAELQAHVANAEDMSARLANETHGKAKAIAELTERLGEFENWLNLRRNELQEISLPPKLTIEDLSRQLSSFDKQMTSIRAELEAARKEAQVSKERALSLAEESKCPLCMQPLSENYRTHVLENIEEENLERDRRQAELQKNCQEVEKLREIVNRSVMDFQAWEPNIKSISERIAEEKDSKENLEREFEVQQTTMRNLTESLESIRKQISTFDVSELENVRRLHEEAIDKYHTIRAELESHKARREEASTRIEDFRQRLANALQKVERRKNIDRLLETVDGIRDAYRSIQPKLRTEFVKILGKVIQSVLDSLVGEEDTALAVGIDETYTPLIRSQEGHEREVSFLSGGERTLLAFAYRFAIGQLIMQARTGHGLQMLLLDEPTESLGREDRSVDRLAETLAKLKAIEQIIAVTHNEAFAEKAEHIVRLEKDAAVSKVVTER
ncbi:MAG: SMC family ATPase [Candidatus Bathyarchaeota archaeon]|nr:MAG: SMC family ATPase [Candidatus Bathyarchaeota archaeon]